MFDVLNMYDYMKVSIILYFRFHIITLKHMNGVQQFPVTSPWLVKKWCCTFLHHLFHVNGVVGPLLLISLKRYISAIWNHFCLCTWRIVKSRLITCGLGEAFPVLLSQKELFGPNFLSLCKTFSRWHERRRQCVCFTSWASTLREDVWRRCDDTAEQLAGWLVPAWVSHSHSAALSQWGLPAEDYARWECLWWSPGQWPIW